MEKNLTKEDVAINRIVAKRIGSWEWLDSRVPSRQYEITERAMGTTGTRIGFAELARIL